MHLLDSRSFLSGFTRLSECKEENRGSGRRQLVYFGTWKGGE